MDFEIDKSKIKAGIIVGSIIVAFIILIIVFANASAAGDDKTNFPEYDSMSIKEKDVQDSSSDSYARIKNKLENDYYFMKESLISNYNYKFYTGANLKQMVWNYVFAFELRNRKYLSSIDYEEGVFCLRSKYVIDSFEELYGVKISENIDLLDGFYEYVKSRSGRYCFNFETVAHDYNNEIKLLVDGISVDGDVITVNVYVFEYYVSGTDIENAAEDELDLAIRGTNIPNAISIVVENLRGKSTHKQIQFKINNSGKFFKYQILNSKNLEY